MPCQWRWESQNVVPDKTYPYPCDVCILKLPPPYTIYAKNMGLVKVRRKFDGWRGGQLGDSGHICDRTDGTNLHKFDTGKNRSARCFHNVLGPRKKNKRAKNDLERCLARGPRRNVNSIPFPLPRGAQMVESSVGRLLLAYSPGLGPAGPGVEKHPVGLWHRR